MYFYTKISELPVFLFPPTSQKHACKWAGYAKLPLGECVGYGALWWTGILSRVKSLTLLPVLLRETVDPLQPLQEKVLTENEWMSEKGGGEQLQRYNYS